MTRQSVDVPIVDVFYRLEGAKTLSLSVTVQNQEKTFYVVTKTLSEGLYFRKK